MKKYFIIVFGKLLRYATRICNENWGVLFKKLKSDFALTTPLKIKPMVSSYVPLKLIKLF